MKNRTISQLRMVGRLEAISFLFLLLVAMPLKYAAGMPAAVKITGMLHGILFILYVSFVFLGQQEKKWKVSITLLLLLAALIPFGPFWAEKKYLTD